MKNKVNIAELLRYAPSGLIEMYLVTEGWCKFDCVFNDVGKRDYIRVHTIRTNKKIEVNCYGQLSPDGECVLFPRYDESLGWENWQLGSMPYCVGSVIVDKFNEPFLITDYYLYPTNPNEPFSIIRFHKFDYEGARFATPDETDKFFKELYDNGYYFTEETKLVVKIGDDEKKAIELGKINARQYLKTTTDTSKGALKAGDEADFVFSNDECKMSALDMAKYKDEEFKKFLCYYFKFGEELFEKFKNKEYLEKEDE